MTEVSFDGLLVVAAIAVAAPLAVATVPGLRRIPAVVLEILAGIAVGPAGFGWVHLDPAIAVRHGGRAEAELRRDELDVRACARERRRELVVVRRRERGWVGEHDSHSPRLRRR